MLLQFIFYLKESRRFIIEILGKTLFKPIRVYRNSCLKNKDFSIISNNCWGGVIYQKLNLPYLSPTVGMFFYAEDYLRFISNLKYYLSIKPVIIPVEQSRYYEELLKLRKFKYFPIGKIDDVEIIFLHYKNDMEAIEKWERRKKRINMSNLIIKFNDQNLCTSKHIKEFCTLDFTRKICFVGKEYEGCKDLIIVDQKGKGYIKNDIGFFKKPINIIQYINNSNYN